MIERSSRDAVATITDVRASGGKIAIEASGFYDGGVGRIDFALVDLTREPDSNVVDCKAVDYAVPLPTDVAAAWTSTSELTPGIPYRLFFHLYDRTTANLIAYDSRDFSTDGA